MNINAQISMLFSSEGMEIEIKDADSRQRIVTISLNPKHTCQALSRLGNVPCEVAIFSDHRDRIGKKMVMDNLEFEIPGAKTFDDNAQAAREIAIGLCKDGWVPDLDFSSKGSLFWRDSKLFATTTTRKWVDRIPAEGAAK